MARNEEPFAHQNDVVTFQGKQRLKLIYYCHLYLPRLSSPQREEERGVGEYMGGLLPFSAYINLHVSANLYATSLK